MKLLIILRVNGICKRENEKINLLVYRKTSGLQIFLRVKKIYESRLDMFGIILKEDLKLFYFQVCVIRKREISNRYYLCLNF